MKKIRIRITSVLLVLILLATSFVPVFAIETKAALTYSKEYNSGSRDVVCTTLDGTSAASYYANYDYDDLSKMSSTALFSTLQSLMRTTHSYRSSYDDCHYKADRTDCTNGSGNVSLIYTSYSATMSQWNGWNREHVWPQSLGGGGTSGGGADLHHVRPSDSGVNSSRGNKLYGESGTNPTQKFGTDPAIGYLGGTYNSTYFEPLDNVKGDVARICLYVYVRWNSDWGASDITDVFQSVDVLLEWCEDDPVDTWEMGRNEVVGSIQGNRNVFIDYPEYAWLIFGREVPAGMTTPSGEAGGNTSSGGSAAPDSGCEHKNTTTTTTPATCAAAGCRIVVCTDCRATVSSTVIKAFGHDYIDNVCVRCSDVTGATSTTPTNGGWTLVTNASELKAGDRIVIVSPNSKGTFVAGNISNQVMASVSCSGVSNNTIEALPNTAVIFTLGGRSGAWTLSNDQGQKLGATNAKKLAWDGGTTTWSISISNGTATIYNTNSSYGRILYNVNSPRFTTYTSETNTAMLLPQIYKYTEATAPAETEISSVSMSLGSTIAMNYYVSGFDSGEEYYMVFNIHGTDSDPIYATEKNGYLVFTFTNIPPQFMGENIVAKLYVSGSNAPVDTLDNYSVKAYAQKVMATYGTNGALMDLVSDMLRYGAAAQIYADYNTDALVTNGLSIGNYGCDLMPDEYDDVRSIESSEDISQLTTSFASVGVRFDFDNKIYVKFRTDDISKIKLVVNGTTVSGLADKVVSLGNGTYAFYSDGILATEFGDVFTVKMYLNGLLHQTLTYSVNSYAYAKYSSTSSDDSLRALVLALYRYGASAGAYVG